MPPLQLAEEEMDKEEQMEEVNQQHMKISSAKNQIIIKFIYLTTQAQLQVKNTENGLVQKKQLIIKHK